MLTRGSTGIVVFTEDESMVIELCNNAINEGRVENKRKFGTNSGCVRVLRTLDATSLV